MSVKLFTFHQQISPKPDALMLLFLQCQSILLVKPGNPVCNCKYIDRFKLTYSYHFLPVIRQNGGSQNEGKKKTKDAKFSEFGVNFPNFPCIARFYRA